MPRRQRRAHRCASDNFGSGTTPPISAGRWLQSVPRRRGSPLQIDLSSLGTLFRRDGLLRLEIEFAQARQHFLCKQRDVRDGVFVVEETALTEHQQMAKAADTVAKRFDLIVHVVRGTRKTGAALDQLLD